MLGLNSLRRLGRSQKWGFVHTRVRTTFVQVINGSHNTQYGIEWIDKRKNILVKESIWLGTS